MRGLNSYPVLVVVAAGLLCSCSYSQIAEQAQAVNGEWETMQRELRQRNDLVPVLVEQVKKYAPEEQDTLRPLEDSRSRLASARTPEEAFAAANQQSDALQRLQAAIGNNQQFIATGPLKPLLDKLNDAEHRIAVERMQYNARVQLYKTTRRPLGAALTASILNFRDYPFFVVPMNSPSKR